MFDLGATDFQMFVFCKVERFNTQTESLLFPSFWWLVKHVSGLITLVSAVGGRGKGRNHLASHMS